MDNIKTLNEIHNQCDINFIRTQKLKYQISKLLEDIKIK